MFPLRGCAYFRVSPQAEAQVIDITDMHTQLTTHIA